MTLFAGVSPWEGGEAWANVEMDQGFGLSGTFGVAAFPSAEAYKVGSAEPYGRLHRLFFRQTFDLGGDSRAVEGAANQLAGSHTSDNLVITVGKFSVTDIFDNNSYAHDPQWRFPELGDRGCRCLRLCRRCLGLYLWRRGGMELRQLDAARRAVRHVAPAQLHGTGDRLRPISSW